MIFNFNRSDPTQFGQTIAIIDIGTNSARLLVVRVNPDLSYKIISQRKESIRLGQGEFPSMQLQPEAMHRALLVCHRFVEMAKAKQVDEILAVATSATRDARNQAEFLRRLRREAGLEVRVISGKEEARLIYIGISSGLHLEGRRALFLDIGGGSTELIVGHQLEYDYLDTLQLGHIRLTMNFLKDDTEPISQERYQQIQEHVRDVAVRVLQKASQFELDVAVGSSGTIENLAEMAARRSQDPAEASPSTLSLAALTGLRQQLCGLPLNERRKFDGMDEDRADVIIAGAAILETIMQELKIEEIRVSDRSLRDGLLLDYLSRLGRQHPEAGSSFRETSVIRLGRSLGFNEAHARQVAGLSLQLFDSSLELEFHDYGEWERDMLYYASLLHDIGISLSYSSHHSHSYYFIQNADLLGFDQTELQIMATLAYFHRKQAPKKKYKPYRRLRKPMRKRIRKLSSLLAIAESLDRSHLSLVEEAWFSAPKKKKAVLHLNPSEHCPLELWGVDYQKQAFKKAYKRSLSVQMEGIEHPLPLEDAVQKVSGE